MCSYCSTMRILFFILLQQTSIYSTHKVSLENDITKYIDNWVTSIFTISGENGAKQMAEMYYNELKEFEYNINNQGNNFSTKYIFQNIRFERAVTGAFDEMKIRKINWKFSESKISAFFEELKFSIPALIKVGVSSNNEKSSRISIYATYKNFTSTVLRSYARDNDLKITHDFTCSVVDYWSQRFWYDGGNLTTDDEKQLEREIKPILPTILLKSLNNSQKSIPNFDVLFQEYEKPRQEIISILPDFLTNPQKYYYLIPRIPFFCFVLKRVAIYGLSNFESYQVRRTSEIFTHTLLIKNIHGSMTLDYRSEQEKDLKLKFQIHCFMITKKNDTGCVYGLAKYYTITRSKTNTTLSSCQSEVIMNKLESVVASMLLSSKEVGQMCDVEMPVEKIKISNCSDWKTIKESYKEWIPFNDDKVIKK